MGIDENLTATDTVPWSDHFALKTQLSIPTPSCLGSKLIYAPQRRLMDPISFQKALQDPVSPSDLLDELMEDWHNQLLEAIKTTHTHQYPLGFWTAPVPGYTLELQRIKQKLRQTEGGGFIETE